MRIDTGFSDMKNIMQKCNVEFVDVDTALEHISTENPELVKKIETEKQSAQKQLMQVCIKQEKSNGFFGNLLSKVKAYF